ncbi:MAG: hypothetical protein KBF37_06070 [Saprospiraceae bacterium]|jgi:ribosomal 30S subunit maturation factor RimM|nr:hypothetical protein [Saprospiraceae bacterium]MBP9209878.1 hypothetical protein [Saprospiraceae bacterium]MBV6472703.1 Ribosome maturation factor RimM [Saprospiraceae bacterium]
MIELVRAGRTFRTHGLEGKISFEVDPAFVNCIREGEALFFDVDGNSVPFFISSVESNGDEYLILEDVDAPEKARTLCNQDFFVDRNSYPEAVSSEATESKDDAFDGYLLIDRTSGKRGTILRTEVFPMQLLAVVELEGRSYYVPLRDEWIDHLDPASMTIETSLPEGMFS